MFTTLASGVEGEVELLLETLETCVYVLCELNCFVCAHVYVCVYVYVCVCICVHLCVCICVHL
jgi:hypothetical protein